MNNMEELAKEIYWAAYDQYLGPSYVHCTGDPKNPTIMGKEEAWKKCSPEQKKFNLHQARRALAWFQENNE